MNDLQKNIWNVLVGKDAETAVRLILDYHGTQLFDEGFGEFLVDEDACDNGDIFPEERE